MTTVSSSLRLFDQFSQPLRNVTNAMNTTISAMERMNRTANNDIRLATQMQTARSSIREAEVAFRQMEQQQRRSTEQQNNLNNAIRGGSSETRTLLDLVKQIGIAFLGWRSVKAIFDYAIVGSAKLEQQLTTISGMLGNKQVGEAFFKQIRDYALISQYGLKDFASISRQFIQFTKNTDKLMDLNKLAERLAFIDPTQGLEGAGFALKEILGGDGMSLKGRFGFSSAEIKKLKGADTMEEFMQMFDRMLSAKGGTTQAVEELAGASISQFENLKANIITSFADAGKRSLEVINPLLTGLNLAFREGKFDAFFTGLNLALQTVTQALMIFVNIATSGLGFIGEIFVALIPIILAMIPPLLIVAGAWAGYNLAVFLAGVYTKVATIASTAYMLATNGIARALTFAIIKQKALNLVMSLNPVGIVVAVIMTLIGALLAFNFVTEGVRKTFVDAFGVIVDSAEWAVNSVIKILNGGIKGINKVSKFFADLLGVEHKAIQEIQYRADYSEFKKKGQDFLQNVTLDSIKDKFLPKDDDKKNNEIEEMLKKWNSQQNDNFGAMGDDLKKIKGAIDISNEDLKTMRELAEMQNIQNFVTLTPTVNVEATTIEGGGFDVDTIVSRITTTLEEEIASSAQAILVG